MKQFFLSSFFILVAVTCFGQQRAPAVTIVNPLNGSMVGSNQVKITYDVTEAAPTSVKISVDGRSAQLIVDARLGENTAMVDIPEKDCTITVVAQNDAGASAPATVNLKRSANIFKPSLYVLAIGVSAYDNPDLQLQFPAKDASDFSQTLIRQAGLLYEGVEVKLLTDRKATAENIRDGLQWLQSETTTRDIAMLYIAGHGVNNHVGDFFYVPVNADLERINATCVSYTDIKKTIDAVAGKLLVFMDACHSGNVLGNSQQRATGISQAVSELTNADNGPVVFTSSTGRQFSLESSEWNNGAFTKALVEGLSGHADYGNQTVTVKSLDFYISKRVKELTKGQQAPTTIIPQSVSDYPVAVVTDGPLVPVDAVAKTKAITFAIDAVAPQKYTGKQITPSITVKDGEKTLIQGTDYTVTYGANTKAGTGSIAVAWAENYAGSEGAATFVIRNAREIVLGLSAGVSAYGNIPFGDVGGGFSTVIGADAAWYMNRYMGVGVKWNMRKGDANFGTSKYSETLSFMGPTVYIRWLKRNRLSVVTGVSAGAMSWKWTLNDSFTPEESASATTVGGFLTTGVNFMLSPNIGLGANVQTALGSLKDDRGSIRKPAGAGATVGVVFSF